LQIHHLRFLHKFLFKMLRKPKPPRSTVPAEAVFHRLFRASCGGAHASLDGMVATRILVVEDEPDIAEVLQFNLERAGFSVAVERRGDSALEAIRRRLPDLVVLDLMLPGLDGLELARVLKRDPATSTLPLVMLTAKGEELDRIVGLELGADDYISKPFSPREVVLRIKAVLRRHAGEEEPSAVIESGRIRLDAAAHRAEVRGSDVPLTATEFRLLRLLMERQGRVQTRARLLTDVWGYAEDVDSRTVDTHVRRLRHKLGAESDRIETVIGVGYRMRA
jgi:two-component system, OmpR family, phosphate regulon response regulator PhoB